MTHLINRLQFELNCTNEDQAFNFRQNFGITFQGQIIDAADKVCSNHVQEDEWIKIERLEIDLGSFSPAAFDANLSSVFKSKFEKALADKLSIIPSSQKKESLLVSKVELLKHFLQTGTLPWWVAEQDIDIDEIMIDLIANQPETIKRFFYHHQFKKDLWTRASFQLNNESKTQLIFLIEELKTAKELFLKWIEQLNILLKNKAAAEINIPPGIDDILLKNAPQIFQNKTNENILLEVFKKNITVKYIDEASRIKKIIAENKGDFIDETYEATGAVNATQTDDKEIITGKYAIKHAGVILLSPFLKPLFTNLHLLNGKEWKNKDAQYKAVHLLKFLSTGEQKAFEYSLVLEKIICGLNIEEPIPLDVELNEDEIDEAIQLLNSVIEHWKALKNTSVNGLRESFLKRDGILTQKENGWLLQVERKTLDVLIDSIPWGYSTIAFSWNEHLIFVEW